ncbi:MAG: pectate lyase [Chitinophagaceae bacterium]|nr:pectate lyase [Chitinophagaceae bacterium]
MRILLIIPIILAVIISAVSCTAQNIQTTVSKNYLDLSWKEVATKMPDEWYSSDEAKMAADSVLKYQTQIGGWPKNNSFHKGMDQEEWLRIVSSGIGATFDNGATVTEMIFLAKMYGKIKDDRYHSAFEKAFNYILEAQYKNGGWPQFYPYRKGNSVSYASHITYNDNAMVNVLQLLKDITEEKPLYKSLQISSDMKAKAKAAFDKGIDCILKTQIRVNDKLTVWCAQHDEFTLLPANARTYEQASFSGQESVGIVQLLMEVNNPSKEIIEAVKAAMKWFDENKITGIKVENRPGLDGKKNIVVVEDNNAPPLWARFYDLETGKPFFCDRDGVKKSSLKEIGDERRNGYSWYGNGPEKLLKKYPEWTKKWNVN